MTTSVTPTTDLDSTELRKAFGAFPTGVVALAGMSDAEPTVIVASSFAVGVSQEPPLVMFAVQQSSTTWPILRDLPSLGVSVLGESHTEVIRQLSSKDKTQRFAGVATTVLSSGALLLDDAPVHFECAIESSHTAGDHEIVVLRVTGLANDHSKQPIVFHRSAFARLSA
ncbi:flavin reductase family protein [Gordonia rubripertincta]|uniref:flavin reductase family protein n=1 Tax=Gordonia rubripertincta TaxID=36822 RepID=UPI00117C8FB1|nr:flavin reductase family protein [Gordonia rubripertincta]TSD94529.1 flavin reductase family protein [Gordonia rubripertincta]